MLKKMNKNIADVIRRKADDYLSINPYAGKRLKEDFKGF
jgi:hypothetical protein